MTTISQRHRVAMPMAEDTAAPGGYLVTEERRSAPRTRSDLTAHVSGFGQTAPLICSVDDISEGGLSLCVPIDAGVCVGRRCELVLAARPAGPGHPACVDEPIFATVVRTLPLGDGHTSGVGLRFDNPIYL